MNDNFSQPRVKKTSRGLTITYETSQRTHTVKAYPIETCNGSSVILIGHENGVKVIWRGGKDFKPRSPISKSTLKVNGSGSTVVLIDSDDEVPAPVAGYEEQPEFMEDEDEFDLTHPYPRILQILDLSFGTSALQIAVLPLSIIRSYRDLVGKKIIFVSACADNALRLVTLPLIPPSPSVKAQLNTQTVNDSINAGNGKWGEKVILLNGHEKFSNGVSITLDPNEGEPCYVIASFSHEVNGRLLLWSCSLENPVPQLNPFQSIFLASPGRTISFNPSLSKPNYLLIAEARGVCRIFEYYIPKRQNKFFETQSSVHGCWHLSLMTDFPSIKNKFFNSSVTHAGFGRKNIVDAKWVLDGCAILVLLDGGEWGIWDLEGLRMGVSNSQSLLKYQGIRGGAKTQFSLTGFIESSMKVSGSGLIQKSATKFVPITPGTRKSLDPFKNHAVMPTRGGQISVIETPSSVRQIDEAILFRVGATYAIIPSMLKYWSSYFSKGQASNIYGDELCGQIIKFQEVDLQGERCSAAELIPLTKSTKETTASEIIILGEHRFVIVNYLRSMASSLTERLAVAHKQPSNLDVIGNDQLDIMNIEIALEKMEERNASESKRKAIVL